MHLKIDIPEHGTHPIAILGFRSKTDGEISPDNCITGTRAYFNLHIPSLAVFSSTI